jgi:ribosome recycling factor
MGKALDHLRAELAGLRTGRASPGMLEHLPVPGAYGDGGGGDSSGAHAPPLRALAATTARDAHMLVVTPFDPATLPALEAALRDGPLALQPQRSSGGELVVPVPPPTKDAAAGMLKVARAAAEAARAAVRHARRSGMEAAKAAHAAEDDRRVVEKQVQRLTDEHTATVDKLVAAKEKALSEV